MKPGDLVTLKFPENFVIGDAVALVISVDEPHKGSRWHWDESWLAPEPVRPGPAVVE